MENTQERLHEIEGWLNAYRQGWVSWDAQHVQELRDERFKLASPVPLIVSESIG